MVLSGGSIEGTWVNVLSAVRITQKLKSWFPLAHVFSQELFTPQLCMLLGIVHTVRWQEWTGKNWFDRREYFVQRKYPNRVSGLLAKQRERSFSVPHRTNPDRWETFCPPVWKIVLTVPTRKCMYVVCIYIRITLCQHFLSLLSPRMVVGWERNTRHA